MSDINKFTTKEVLNKVLLDSSGNSVAANSHTSQEALNAVLDTANSRLNVSLGGSNTISGDVTITGDLTVQGGGSLAFDEIIEGTQVIDVDSTEALLVRKNGDSGDVFIVDTQNSRVGVGGAPSTDVEFFNTASNTASEVAITSQSSGGNASALILRSNRNNTVGSHTVVTNGQFLGQILFQGSDGTDYEDAARIFATVDGSPAGDATDMPGALNFATTADGSDSMTTHMKIDNAGNVLIGTTSTFGRFYVQNNVVDQTGLLIKHAPASTSTASVGNISADNSNATATNGVLRVHHEDPPANVKMIQVDTTGSNTVKFSVDEDGDGYFAGTLGIGTTSTDGTLHVHTATAGSVAADGAADDLVVENSGAGGITILTPNNALGQLAFGSPADAYGAFIGWKSDDNQMTIATANAGDSIVLQTANKATALTIDSSQNATFASKIGIGISPIGTLDINISTDARGSFTSSIGEIGSGVFALQVTNAAGSALKPMGIRAEDIRLVTGSVSALTLNSSGSATFAKGVTISNGNLDIAATKKLFFDAGGDTYIHEQAADKLDFFVGNGTRFVLDVNSRISLSNNDVGGSGGDGSTTGNTLLGYAIGDMDVNSINNTLIGHKVAGGGTHADMRANVGIGTLALYAITEGDNNIAIGKESADAITSGSANVAIGTSSLGASTTTNNNVAVGTSVLQSLNTSSQNTAIGSSAMSSIGTNASGLSNCVAIGYQAFQGGTSTTTGANNTVAIGMNSLFSLTTGAGNTAVGANSAGSLVEGQFNTVLGYNAFDAGQEDSQCVAIGYEALTNADVSDTGSAVATHNTAVGYASGDVVTTGIKNTLIGSATDPSANSGTNQAVIGFGATGQADNSVTLGNGDVTRVYMSQDGDAEMYANGTINTSDKRLKEDISNSNLGLSFINKLRPVSYKFKNDKKPEKLKYGIIAQEVQEVLKESGNEDFAGITDKGEYLGADYVQFIAPLIKAVQELSAKVEELEKK